MIRIYAGVQECEYISGVGKYIYMYSNKLDLNVCISVNLRALK